ESDRLAGLDGGGLGGERSDARGWPDRETLRSRCGRFLLLFLRGRSGRKQRRSERQHRSAQKFRLVSHRVQQTARILTPTTVFVASLLIARTRYAGWARNGARSRSIRRIQKAEMAAAMCLSVWPLTTLPSAKMGLSAASRIFARP